LKPLPEDQWLGSSSSASPAAQQYAGGIGIPSRSKSLGHRRTATVPTSLDKGGLEASKSAAAAAGEAAIGGTWSVEKEQIVLGPYDYIVQQPGKDIRKQLIAAFNRWLQVPRESLEIITRVVLMLHTASLL
jgi:geranylgeranyl diphosphate synthase type 3